jgi:hypothetical protein
MIGETEVVFVHEGNNVYEPLVVTTGVRSKKFTEIVSGLSMGAEYVSNGAFELKSQTSIGAMGEHAG